MPDIKRSIPAAFVILWATGFIGARYAMPWSEPFTFLAARFLLAAAILLALALALHARAASRRQAFHSLIAGALMHGGYLGALFWAIRHGMPAGISAVVIGLQPLLTALMAGPVLGEKILPRHWLGLLIGFVGVFVVLSPRLGVGASGVTMPTLAAMGISVTAMSAGTIWQKRHATSANVFTGTFWQYVGGAIPMVIGSALFETRTVVWNGELVFAMAWLVLVLSIGAIFLLMILIREGEMAKVASLFYLVPAVTAVIAWFLFGEELTPVQIGGMAIATIGVWLATAQAPTLARASR